MASQIQILEFRIYTSTRPLLKSNCENIQFYAIFLSEVSLRCQGTLNMLVQRESNKNAPFWHFCIIQNPLKFNSDIILFYAIFDKWPSWGPKEPHEWGMHFSTTKNAGKPHLLNIFDNQSLKFKLFNGFLPKSLNKNLRKVFGKLLWATLNLPNKISHLLSLKRSDSTFLMTFPLQLKHAQITVSS